MNRRKKIIVLGATGSIGLNALDVATRAVGENDADICLVATVGLSGLAPTMAAIEKGMDVALATKEVLVMAGEVVTRAAQARDVRMLPVDSEHSAIFQCLAGGCRQVDRLTLTASGGPFLDGPADLSSVTVEQALCHPRWKMGPKVTIDSATMMNKGFEVLEARWIFDVPAVLAAADEWAVNAFVQGKIGFSDIPRVVENCLEGLDKAPCDTVEAVFETVRRTEEWIGRRFC